MATKIKMGGKLPLDLGVAITVNIVFTLGKTEKSEDNALNCLAPAQAYVQVKSYNNLRSRVEYNKKWLEKFVGADNVIVCNLYHIVRRYHVHAIVPLCTGYILFIQKREKILKKIVDTWN